jgi:signal transduction histidine kinase
VGAQLLAQKPEAQRAPEIASLLSLFERQIDRLGRMVSDLADAVHVEAGEFTLEVRSIDLREIAREAVQRHQNDSPAHPLSASLPDHPVIVPADPHRLAQVADNLISNAIKYSPGGGPVMVGVSRTANEASLWVRDSGIGIAPSDRELIFQPFRRIAMLGEAQGVGLGLSVVRRIAVAHGGRVDIESDKRRGSTFSVALPLRR